MNVCTLIGRVGTDPEMRYTPSGTPVTRFRLAVDAPPRGQGQERQTDWLTIICFGRQAEVVSQYMEKGRMVAVLGRVHNNQWETQEGQRRETVEIIANRVEFLGGRSDSDRGGADRGGDRGGERRRPSGGEGGGGRGDIAPPDDLEFPPDEEIFGDL